MILTSDRLAEDTGEALRYLVEEGLAVRLPHDTALPHYWRGKVFAGERLLRLYGRALGLLMLEDTYLGAAANEDTMARQKTQPAAVRMGHTKQAHMMRMDAKARYDLGYTLIIALLIATVEV